MAAKLGANDAAIRLGNQAVSVYLGAVEVYAPGITLYFNGAVTSDWATLGNWWLNAGHTVAATALPTVSDSVVATADIEDNSGGALTVVNVTMEMGLYTNITVTGMATFNGTSEYTGQLTGNATFNGSSQLFGTITGDATFNDSSQNNGDVLGNITDNR